MLKLRQFMMKQCLRSYSSTPDAVMKEFNTERSLNKIQIIGRVGQDPMVAGSERKVVMFSLATNEYQGNDESGVAKMRTDWHRISVFIPRLQTNTEKYVRQGDRLHVTGKLHYDLVKDKSGLQRYITSILAEDIIHLGKNRPQEEGEVEK